MGTLKIAYILHGWTFATQDEDPLIKWKDLIRLLDDNGIDVTLLKVPGLTQNSNNVYTLDDYVIWLNKSLEKQKGKVILIGHSNGGRIAAAFSASYPEKIEHLILIDSAGIAHNEFHSRFKRAVFRSLAKIGKKITTSEKIRVLLYKLAREGDYKNANEAQRKTMLNLIYLDLTETFEKIKVPTLIIWGAQDNVTPLSDGKLIHQLIEGSKLFIVEGARHAPQFTHTKEVVQKIIKEINNGSL